MQPRGFIAYFASHRTLANIVLVVMVLAGIFAASRMRAQYFPDVVVSEVSVSVAWEGAGAEDIDRAIVSVLEPSLLAVEGVVSASSTAREGRATIVLEFDPNADLMTAADAVQAAVDTAPAMPADAETPEVTRNQWRDQVTDVVVTGPMGIDQLARITDEFVARLFQAGITRATVRGLADPETVIEVPSTALLRHDISLREIADAVAIATASRPAGEVGDGSARVRTGDAARSPDDLRAIVLRSAADGTKLTLGDVADVRALAADRGQAAFVGNDPAMTLRIDRNAEGDAIAMQATVARVAKEMAAGLPQGVKIDLVRTRAEQITDRLSLLIDNAISGLVLVVALLFLFLNARTALWVAAGIPVAMLAGIAGMYALGMTLNMISLFALIIMLGIVVDDAIVVGEHADFRARKLGEDPLTAATGGANAMAMPVVASTLTTVIAFIGLVAIGGRFGDLIADIPLTVTLVLLASLVECFLILPNHMVHALRATAEGRWYDRPSDWMNARMARFEVAVVKPVTRRLIAWRYPVVAGVFALLCVNIAFVIRGDVPFRFFNAPEQASVTGNFSMLPSATRDDSIEMMRELQRAADAVGAQFAAEYGANPITFAVAEVGTSGGRGLASADGKDPDQLGAISIELISADDRPYSSASFVQALQEEVRAHPLMEELSFRGGRFGPGGDALSVDLFGADTAQLKAAAEALKARLSVFPEVSALEDSLAYDKDELILNLTPLGQAMGLSPETLGATLRERLSGIEAATFPEGTRTATIRVALPDAELAADFLDRTLVRTEAGGYVPMADVVQVERRAGFSTIERENGLRIVTVSGDIAEDNPARAAEIQEEIRNVILPRLAEDFGITTRQGGLVAQEREFLGDAGIAAILCLTGIFICLAWIFASWSRPFIVMAVIPFGLIGAIGGHAIWGIPMSLFSVVGMIGMAGIIINDSIVLVSTIDEYAQKRGRIVAIVDGVADRLRPVLLTTLTTVLGLAPLLFERSSQAEFLKPTVVTLVFGLGFGLVLVLVLVPVLLAMERDVTVRLAALWRGMGRQGSRQVLRSAMWQLGAAFGLCFLPVLAAGQTGGMAVIGFLVFAGLAAGVVMLAYRRAAVTARDSR